MQKTALYNQHQQQQANLVDFHHWLMPLHYGSQLDEHHAVRNNVGMFDVSHMTVIDCRGPQASDFLRYVLANDIAKLQVNRALYSCLLNEQGGILDDLIAYKISATYFRLVVNSATREKDFTWLQQHSANFAVDIQALESKVILAVQGPNAIKTVLDPKLALFPAEICARIIQLKPFQCYHDDSHFIARTGYTGEQGLEIIVAPESGVVLWQKLQQAGVTCCGLAARDTLRLEAGLHLYGNDMNEQTSPLVSNLAWTVDFSDEQRNFIGKTALQVELATENYPSQLFIGVLLQDKGVLRQGQTLVLANGVTGELTSGAFSPTLNQGIGLARIAQSQFDSDQAEVLIRGKAKSVRLVKPVFVRNGASVVQSLAS